MLTNPRRSAARRPVRRKTPAWLPAALILALLAAGCGSDGDSMAEPGDDSSGNQNNGSNATFSVTMSGDESFASTGTYALSGGTAAEHGWELWLGFLDASQPLQQLEINGADDRPGPGTYTIVSPAVQAGVNEYYALCRMTSGESYYASGGTLTIDASSDATVEGSFGFAAESPSGAMVNVSGTFRADDLLDE